MSEVYICTGAFQSNVLSEILSIATKEDIRYIELSSGIQDESDVVEAIQKAQNLNYLVHNYFPPERTGLVINLASADKIIRTRSVNFAKHAINLCSQIGSRYYSIHSGFCVDPSAKDLGSAQKHLRRTPLSEAKDNFRRSLIELSAYAKPRDIKICIENNNLEKQNLIDGRNLIDLMVSPADYREFVSIDALQDIEFLIDLGHLKVSSHSLQFDPYDLIEAASDRISMFHISDNNGEKDTNGAIDDKYWATGVLSEFNDKLFILEVYDINREKMAEQVTLLEEMKARS